jgi:twitching motility protein PilT
MNLTAEIQRIMSLARRAEASDIHIVAGLPPLFRINDEIILADAPPLSREDTKRLSYSLLNEEQIRFFEAEWQLCCSVLDDKLGRFRVTIYLQTGNPEMSIRPVSNIIRKRQDLRLPDHIDELTRLSSGLVLITGPTGSGKTTTLNYLIDIINSERRCKIITIEDPVEYVHTQKKAIIVQQELHTDVKSFAKAMIHVLRQDPDVVCIGEMRDMDTIATALMAAETGHLVIATCHTPNCFQTIERIVSIFPDNQQLQVIMQLSNCLKAIIAQRLVGSVNKKQRVLATEFLLVDAPTQHHIREHEFHQIISVIQTGRKKGMHLMDDSLYDLYQAGEITYESAINNSFNPRAMRERVLGQDKKEEQ